jgi:geranylgeranyl diphosphate synthase type I
MPIKPSYQQLREQFEDYLTKTVLLETIGFPLLQEMIFYHFGWQTPKQPAGKRLRPLLTLLSAELFTEEISKAYPSASALEILHNFTLIHDDIEDNSDFRHGQMTLWKKYGIAHAINTGDYLSSLALVSISHAETDRPELMLATFLESAIAVTKGQHEDIRFESLPTVSDKAYLDMVSQKTASLFSASLKLGALSAGASDSVLETLGGVGHQFGVAYQIYDDYIGVWGDPKLTGKPAGIDLIERKKSYPALLGIERNAGFAASMAADTPLETKTVSKMIRGLTNWGIQDRVRAEIAHYLEIANLQLDEIEKDHGLEVSRLKKYVNSLFKLG